MKVIYLIIIIFFTIGCGKKQTHTDHPQFIFAQLISDKAPNVLRDVSLFLSSKHAYKQQYKDNLEYHGYEAPFDDEFDFTFVIVESLKANGLAIVVDWREDPQFVFDSLNQVTNNQLSNCTNVKKLQSDFAQTEKNISFYLESKGRVSLLSKCTSSLGLEIVGINNGSDSYVLSVVSIKDLSKIFAYAKKAGIELNIWGNSEY